MTDWDPEGQMIPQVAGRTLINDFCVNARDLEIIPAGVTREQIERYHLQPQNFAKEGSSNRQWFIRRNGGNAAVYELEALRPPDMQADLDKIIRGVLDIDLFNREVATEREESPYLEACRTKAIEAMRGLADDEEE
jgi:hypothetical protein